MFPRILSSFALSLFVIVATVAPRASADSIFMGLGSLGGGVSSSRAWAISSDGSTIVGESTSDTGVTEAFRWTRSTGISGLGDLAGGAFESVAYGVSADGSVIVGAGRSDASGSGREAFRWTAGTGMIGLGDLEDGSFDSVAFGVSADGSVVVGSGSTPNNYGASAQAAFRWSSSDGMKNINVPSPLDELGYPNSSASYAVSADGSTIVGRFSNGGLFDDIKAGVWTAETGWTAYPGATGGDQSGQATAISSDGSVIVGSVNAPSNDPYHNAIRWERPGETSFLHDLGEDQISAYRNTVATGVSSDGSIIIGNLFAEQLGVESSIRPALSMHTLPFIWDSQDGFRLLQDVLVDLGVDLGGWQLLEVRGISANGSTLTGTGLNPFGQFEAWVVSTDSSIGGAERPPVVPEPSTIKLGLLGMVGMFLSLRIGNARRRLPSHSPIA